MQHFFASSTQNESRLFGFSWLDRFRVRSTLKCCIRVHGRPMCHTYNVPFFENCHCDHGQAICKPPVLQNPQHS